MAIRSPQGPAGAPNSIGKAMRDLGLRGPLESLTISASQPIPVFSLQLDEIGPGFLGRARRSGWRYLLAGRKSAADVDDNAEFDGIVHGELPDLLMQACQHASSLFEARPEQFEARILEIPALYVVALWIFGPEQVFFSLLDLDGASALVPLPESEFVAHVIALSDRAKRKSPDPEKN
jgi:hypothetical protein